MNTRQATAGIPAGSWAAPKVAWLLCGLALALIACAVVLAVLNGADVDAVSFPLAMTVSAVVGGLVARAVPRTP